MPEATGPAVAMSAPGSRFVEQAPRFDTRAGLPPTDALVVARAIVECAGAGRDDLVVELGAGTGEIGVHLSSLPIRYLGLDSSTPMLDVFRAKAPAAAPLLVLADCDQPWPLRDSEAAVVFASRVIHLLDPDHVVRETLRVCRPGGMLILGRVHFERGGMRQRLRRRRRQLLRDIGVNAKDGEEGTQAIVDRCVAAGGESLGRRVIAVWTTEMTPDQILTDWALQPQWGSVSIDPITRSRLLDDLRAWAQVEFGDLGRLEPLRERYAIDVVRLADAENTECGATREAV